MEIGTALLRRGSRGPSFTPERHEPQDRTADRLRGGSDAAGGAGRDAAGTLVNGERVKMVAWLAHAGSSYAS
jgi:hypothetical protein